MMAEISMVDFQINDWNFIPRLYFLNWDCLV